MPNFIEKNLMALLHRQPEIVRIILESKADESIQATHIEEDGFVFYQKINGEIRLLSRQENPKKHAFEFANNHQSVLEGKEPLFFTGIRGGYEILEMMSRITCQDWEPYRAVYVFEENTDLLRLNFLVHDWSAEINRGRLYFFVGSTAQEQCFNFFSNNLTKPQPSRIIALCEQSTANRCAETLSKVKNEILRNVANNKKNVDQYYKSLSDSELAGAYLNPASLRILIISNKLSYFIRYSVRDIRMALEEMGAQCLVFEEESAVDRLTGPWLLQELDRFKPNGLIFIDHLRAEYANLYPPDMPFFTWVQDHVRSIHAEPSPESIKRRDLLVGYTKGLEDLGYSSDHLFELPTLTNPEIFRPRDGEIPEKYRCDFSYVSNISFESEQRFSELLEMYKDRGPEILNLIHKIRKRVESRYREENYYESPVDFHNEMLLHIRESGLEIPDALSLGYQLYDHLVSPLFRKQPLEWLLEDGHTLNLWGRGWEKHSTLFQYAKGVVENGPDLVNVYLGTTINVHLNPYQVEHPRILDGLMAGGFFLVRKVPSMGLLDLRECMFYDQKELKEKITEFFYNPDRRKEIVERNQRIIREWATYKVGIELFFTYFAVSLFNNILAHEIDDFLPVSEKAATNLIQRINNIADDFYLDVQRFGLNTVCALLIAVGILPEGAEKKIESLDKHHAKWGCPSWPPSFSLIAKNALSAVVNEISNHSAHQLENKVKMLLFAWINNENQETLSFRHRKSSSKLSDEQQNNVLQLISKVRPFYPGFRHIQGSYAIQEYQKNLQCYRLSISTKAATACAQADRFIRLKAFVGAWESLKSACNTIDNEPWLLCFAAMSAEWLGQRDEGLDYLDRIESGMKETVPSYSDLKKWAALLRAQIFLANGDPQKTLNLLRNETPFSDKRTLLHILRSQAMIYLRNYSEAIKELGDPNQYGQEKYKIVAEQYEHVLKIMLQSHSALHPIYGNGKIKFIESRPIPPGKSDELRIDKLRILSSDKVILRTKNQDNPLWIYDLNSNSVDSTRFDSIEQAGKYPAFDAISGHLYIADVQTPQILIFDDNLCLQERLPLPSSCTEYLEDLAAASDGSIVVYDPYYGELWFANPSGDWRKIHFDEIDVEAPLRIARFGNGFITSHGYALRVFDNQGKLFKEKETDIFAPELFGFDNGAYLVTERPARFHALDLNLEKRFTLDAAAPGYFFHRLSAVGGEKNDLLLVDDFQSRLFHFQTEYNKENE